MANRCPDCNKFVSLETPEPDEEAFDFQITEDGVDIQATLQQNRECAECGTVMKSYCHDLEESIDWETIGVKLDGWSLPDLADFALLWESENTKSTFLVEVTSDGTSVEEGGGGRYAKNMITSELSYTINVQRKQSAYDINYEGTLKGEAAASEFEDEC